jgi:ADP-ribose pyrophosphatase YjhB (NUDIX family)
VVWRNAVPLACVVVTDGDRVLLVDAASKPGYNVPGGHPEYDEEPVVAALRELEEETGLRADPADAELLDVRHRDAPNGLHYWVTYFRVDRADTDGAVVAGSDARATAWFDESALEGDRPHPDAVQLSLPLLTQ